MKHGSGYGRSLAVLFIFLLLGGCGEPEQSRKEPVVIMQTPTLSLTRDEFSDELDLKKAAYPYTISQNPVEYNQMVVDLTKALSDKMVLLSAAQDQGITVTQQELETALSEFMKDYPDDSFKDILLEDAISYPLWHKHFEQDMVIEKLLDQALKKNIEITPEDITAFYEQHQSQLGGHQDGDGSSPVQNEIQKERELVLRLRLQKIQDHYESWILGLKKEYPVVINDEELKTFFIGLKSEGKVDEN